MASRLSLVRSVLASSSNIPGLTALDVFLMRSPIGSIVDRSPCGSSLHVMRAAAYSTRIYTRTGDKGQSSLFNGERRSKSNFVFEALGSSDELTVHIGQAKAACQLLPTTSEAGVKPIQLAILLHHVQESLLRVGSHLATPLPATSDQSTAQLDAKLSRTTFDASLISWVEACIDQMDAQLPPLQNFIIPSGGVGGTLHVTRAVCRRFERDVVRLIESGHRMDPNIEKYVNRLSDFFFVSARYVDHLLGHYDQPFVSGRFIEGQHPDPFSSS